MVYKYNPFTGQLDRVRKEDAVPSGVVTDHGILTGLADDDHLQYVPADGSRGFTSTVSGVYPVEGYHLVTKDYVDDVVASGCSSCGVSTGVGIITNETPSGTIDDSNTLFTLAYTPIVGTLTVALNGLQLEPGITEDYTISGSEIDFNLAPLTDDIILCDYFYYGGTTITGIGGGGGVTDHGFLTGLSDDDHSQYILVDGSRGFTSTVSGVNPTDPSHLTTKNYVDNLCVLQKGSETAISGADTLTVSFASSFPNTDYSVLVTLQNTVDSPVSIYGYAVTATTTSGFTVTFTDDIDSGNYKLNWMAESY